MRLDRFLSNANNTSRQQARQWLAFGEIRVNGIVTTNPQHPVTPFCHIQHLKQDLQNNTARYFMLHKPKGYVSATEDNQHPTVLDLLHEPNQDQLHIAGRLDRNSTGLLLITNDGNWSRALTEPNKNIPKTYRVETADPIHADTATRFAEGIYFDYENITTKPVMLNQLDENSARLTLKEGRYHQIKRMFGRFRNPVTAIHRESIGAISLDPALKAGEYRALTETEIRSIYRK